MHEINERSACVASEEIGLQKGLQQGRAEGIAEGLNQGRLEERDLIFRKLIESGMSEKQASDILGIDTKP